VVCGTSSLFDKVIYSNLPDLAPGDEGKQRMKIENAVPYLGALVTGLDVTRMTGGEWKTLYQTWLDRHVLIVRGQELSKADFLAYSRRFGRLKPHMIKRTRDPENPEITLMGVTSMAKDSDGEKLILNRGEGWHTDSPWDTEICKGTQLYGIELPHSGADTLLASIPAAHSAQPERLQALSDEETRAVGLSRGKTASLRAPSPNIPHRPAAPPGPPLPRQVAERQRQPKLVRQPVQLLVEDGAGLPPRQQLRDAREPDARPVACRHGATAPVRPPG